MNFKNWIINRFKKSNEIDEMMNAISKNHIIKVSGVSGSSKSLIISLLSNLTNRSILYVSKDDNEAENVYYDLQSFGVEKSFFMPEIQKNPYIGAIPDYEVASRRLDTLKSIITNESCIVTVSLDSLLFNIVPKEKFSPYIINIKVNDKIDIEILSKKLMQSGYKRVNKVTEYGDYAIRGDIVDVYFSLYKNPVRIDFFGDYIEDIKTFNPETQYSNNKIDEITIPPCREFVYGDEEIKRAEKMLSDLKGNEEEKELLLQKIKNYQNFEGEQFYLNLFYEKTSIIDYFKNGIVVIEDSKIINNLEKSVFKEYEENYNLIAYKNIPLVKPENLLFSLNDIYSYCKNIIEFNYFYEHDDTTVIKFDFNDIPIYLGNLEVFKNDMKKFQNDCYKIILFAENEIQSERLENIFNFLKPEDDRFDVNDNAFSIYPLSLSYGFVSNKYKIIFLNDHEVFGKKNKINRHFYTKKTQAIDSFMDLKPGDYIVHINHGIGKFVGIERVKSFDIEKDYIAVLYADDDKIFIPIEQLNFIQKYISNEFASPKLDKIGSKGWNKTKERVKESVQELAKELIKLYSFRLNQKGFTFLPDTQWQKEFEAKFPYEETKDQLITLEEVKRDMESPKLMDRLICGDVGFGKTEIAIRASFKAVMSGKQVAILVPTTILAEQHYENFTERLKSYPIKVDMLSRFRSDKEQTLILNDLKTGKVDIIIGTHRLLSNDVVFKNIGLLIIDEEHRFGVRDKEQIKKIKKTIDCLSLTATPIPRTLHMSLANIRDISIINTPPHERQSVETYIMEFNEEIFIEATLRELKRGGQIFFLHNRIKTIYTMKRYIESVIPNAKVVVAHGQLAEDELEDIIHDFLNYKYDIMLTTTIIESGINMPRVNTIFIDNADKFGLAQLYQLRGRVGRSDKKAYAYLFYSANKVLTEDAMKRLNVISQYTELGSGFKIAMKDLEIRGAGNLLGMEQHGDILAVGFQLYCKLLQEAIVELAPEEAKDLAKDKGEVYLELQYNGFIPDSYILDQRQKMEVYKLIAGITYREEIDQLKKALIDRFGKIPSEVDSLFYMAYIRILCRENNISEFIEKRDYTEIKFSKFSDVNINKLVSLINKSNSNIFIKGNSPSSIFIKNNDQIIDFNDKVSLFEKILNDIIE
jgi:transcription-repair coupling factor (superfamily II helicase)